MSDAANAIATSVLFTVDLPWHRVTDGRQAAADLELTMGDPPRGTPNTTADRSR
jgi:hypothetical protein